MMSTSCPYVSGAIVVVLLVVLVVLIVLVLLHALLDLGSLHSSVHGSTKSVGDCVDVGSR